MTLPKERNNATDRETGAHWEHEFCRMSRTYGKVFTPHQFDRPAKSALFYGLPDIEGKSGWTLPDITIWSAPGEHHEIKHKNPTRDGMYGLERYRLNALVRFANTTGQAVFYTVHDWERAGAADSSERVPNDLDHWFVGDITQLSRGFSKVRTDWTYYNGGMRRMEVCYWNADPGPTRVRPRWFRPLAEVWGLT